MKNALIVMLEAVRLIESERCFIHFVLNTKTSRNTFF